MATPNLTHRYTTVQSDLGEFVLLEEIETGRLFTTWVGRDGLPRDAKRDDSMHRTLIKRLQRYFAGDERVSFDDVQTPAGPPFHRACWNACRRIPRGEVRTYAELAELAGGSASAARAAGQAMRNNHVPIIIPCHRVIGSDGTLHGFGGSRDPGGKELTLKARLLELEGALAVS